MTTQDNAACLQSFVNEFSHYHLPLTLSSGSTFFVRFCLSTYFSLFWKPCGRGQGQGCGEGEASLSRGTRWPQNYHQKHLDALLKADMK